MAHHDDVIIPQSIAFGSSTGPSTQTQIVHLASGFRKVNLRWSQKLRKFPIGYNLRSPEDVYTILRIFEAVNGPADSFLIRDWNDWNTTQGSMEKGDEALVTNLDQPLLNTVTDTIVTDGVTKIFQLVKDYSVGATATHRRTVKKPIPGTVTAAVNGVAMTEGPDFSLDTSTGLMTFVLAPGASESPEHVTITWGGQFYTPVAFTGDDFLASLETYDGSSVPNIELLEVRL